MELRKIQDSDFEAKKMFSDNRKGALAGPDFGETNVLSYCYIQKESKSFALGRKKEAMIALMKDQFVGHDRMGNHASKTFDRDFEKEQARVKASDEERKDAKKKKEMETKLFQDQQVADKIARRQKLAAT